MISHQHRYIFVHIPKTAGNSINRVFGIDWQDHKDLARYAAEQPADTFESYFKFAIVRNPWDRLFSDYNYQLKKGRAKNSKLFVFNERGDKRDFAAWVELALAQPDFYSAERWGGEVSPHIHRWSPQLDWLCVNGAPAIDFVARMENLGEGFPAICRRVGLPVQRLPHRNRRLHLHYSHYYEPATRDLVANYYARDIAAFGYDYEDRMRHVRLFLSVIQLRPAPEPTRALDPREQLAALHIPEQERIPEAESTRFVSYPSARRRPPARQRIATLLAAVVISGAGWMGSGFFHPLEAETHFRDDASLPGPLASLVLPRIRDRVRPEFPYQPHAVNRLFGLLPRLLPASSAMLWQVCPGVMPGDSFTSEPAPARARFAGSFDAPPPPPSNSGSSSYSSSVSPPRQWFIRRQHDFFP